MMRPEKSTKIMRRRYLFGGAVQGVGLRPFVYRLANGIGLGGFVRNCPEGVEIEVEGEELQLRRFEAGFDKLPPRANISRRAAEEIEPRGERGFMIASSSASCAGPANLPPDTATCPNCLRELFDPQNRRYRHPFINCTDCGPRLTIVSDLPYDRARTSMAGFKLCDDCAREYGDPADRRFHAEPNACPICGPRLELRDLGGVTLDGDDALALAVVQLMAGRILAIKSIGGFHLAVAADHDKAVKLLRQRKQREAKPLAVMVADLEAAREIADIDQAEAELLSSPARPIVLCRLRPDAPIAAAVAPDLNEIGLMLPYNPLQHLLMADCGPLVMTSGNLTDEPICIENREAQERLCGIAESFLLHDRPIVVRCDDSIARVMAGQPRLIRRSRGYVPEALELHESWPAVVGLGGQLKNTLCIVDDNRAIFSPHVGDLSTAKARDFHSESLELICRLADCQPAVAAVDCHPDYYTTQAAAKLGFGEVISVQHHHAHIVSCMAENGLTGEVLGLALDGTGYGLDSRMWGGELLRCSLADFERLGHLRYFGLPGGEKAVLEPWRTGTSLLRMAYGEDWTSVAVKLGLLPFDVNPAAIETMLAHSLNTPLTSSLGRLCDGVAAILGLGRRSHYEGQAPMLLEACAARQSAIELEFGLLQDSQGFILNPSGLIRAMSEARLAGASAAELSLSFHRAVIAGFSRIAVLAAERTGLTRVCLSGGCCQNRLLFEGLIESLTSAGLDVYTQSRVPAGDGGLALGQAVAAAAQLKLRKA